MAPDWREALAYTDDDLALALRFGWIKRRSFGRGYKQTIKGETHTREQIRGNDEFRALITPLADLADAGRISPEEKHEAQIAICVCACRLNEEQYHQARQALIESGFDPETLTAIESGLDPETLLVRESENDGAPPATTGDGMPDGIYDFDAIQQACFDEGLLTWAFGRLPRISKKGQELVKLWATRDEEVAEAVRSTLAVRLSDRRAAFVDLLEFVVLRRDGRI